MSILLLCRCVCQCPKIGENHASNPLTIANFAPPTIIFERIVPFDECTLARSAHNRYNSYSTIKKCFFKNTPSLVTAKGKDAVV